MLSAPTCTFTIPSIHDDTTLSCRAYHPLTFSSSSATGKGQWQKKAAIIAHPYAPLGGCQNDPVVHAAAVELLKLGFVVGTFNFRGAGSSKGKTSWTGKPETNDYVSFAGFLLHYLNNLQPPKLSRAPEQFQTSSETVPSPIQSLEGAPSDSPGNVDQGVTLILGGYSYGSLITTLLPTTDVILSRFSNVAKASAAAEIISRAFDLSDQWNKEVRHDGEARRGRQLLLGQAVRASSHPMTRGGEEREHGNRKPSTRSGRSLDGLRRSLDGSKRKTTSRNGSRDNDDVKLCKDEVMPPVDIRPLRTFYLLISPLLPPISTLVTMFSKFGIREGPDPSPSSHLGSKDAVVQREKLLCHSSFAIYGDKDMFTSQRKLRKWAESLASESNSRFQFREISGAGHFWVEDGVEEQMRAAVREWVQDIVRGDHTGHSVQTRNSHRAAVRSVAFSQSQG